MATFAINRAFSLRCPDLLDAAWMGENARYIAFLGLVYTDRLAIGAILLAVLMALCGALGRFREPGRLRGVGLLHLVLPWHATDRPVS